jgi:hypothetical protein
VGFTAEIGYSHRSISVFPEHPAVLRQLHFDGISLIKAGIAMTLRDMTSAGVPIGVLTCQQ